MTHREESPLLSSSSKGTKRPPGLDTSRLEMYLVERDICPLTPSKARVKPLTPVGLPSGNHWRRLKKWCVRLLSLKWGLNRVGFFWSLFLPGISLPWFHPLSALSLLSNTFPKLSLHHSCAFWQVCKAHHWQPPQVQYWIKLLIKLCTAQLLSPLVPSF